MAITYSIKTNKNPEYSQQPMMYYGQKQIESSINISYPLKELAYCTFWSVEMELNIKGDVKVFPVNRYKQIVRKEKVKAQLYF